MYKKKAKDDDEPFFWVFVLFGYIPNRETTARNKRDVHFVHCKFFFFFINK